MSVSCVCLHTHSLKVTSHIIFKSAVSYCSPSHKVGCRISHLRHPVGSHPRLPGSILDFRLGRLHLHGLESQCKSLHEVLSSDGSSTIDHPFAERRRGASACPGASRGLRGLERNSPSLLGLQRKQWMGTFAGNTLASALPWYVGAARELWTKLC